MKACAVLLLSVFPLFRVVASARCLCVYSLLSNIGVTDPEKKKGFEPFSALYCISLFCPADAIGVADFQRYAKNEGG